MTNAGVILQTNANFFQVHCFLY